MRIGLVLTLLLADLSLKSNICSRPGDWLISHGVATTIHPSTGSKTQGRLVFALLLGSSPAVGGPLPSAFLTEAMTLPRQFTTAALCSVIKGKS